MQTQTCIFWKFFKIFLNIVKKNHLAEKRCCCSFLEVNLNLIKMLLILLILPVLLVLVLKLWS